MKEREGEGERELKKEGDNGACVEKQSFDRAREAGRGVCVCGARAPTPALPPFYFFFFSPHFPSYSFVVRSLSGVRLDRRDALSSLGRGDGGSAARADRVKFPLFGGTVTFAAPQFFGVPPPRSPLPPPFPPCTSPGSVGTTKRFLCVRDLGAGGRQPPPASAAENGRRVGFAAPIG